MSVFTSRLNPPSGIESEINYHVVVWDNGLEVPTTYYQLLNLLKRALAARALWYFHIMLRGR